MNMSKEEKAKIEEKIKKLLALATSDNPNEAATAMRQAMKLMVKHSISEDDLSDDKNVVETYESDYVRIPQFMRTLYCGVARAFGVFAVMQNGYYDRNAKVFISGNKQNVRRAMYVYVVAYRLIEDKASEFKSKYDAPKSLVNDYKNGVAMGFVDNLMESFKVEEAEEYASTGKDLVPVDTRYQDAKEFMKNSGMKWELLDEDIRKNQATNMGIKDGQSLRVNEGLDTSGNRTVLLK